MVDLSNARFNQQTSENNDESSINNYHSNVNYNKGPSSQEYIEKVEKLSSNNYNTYTMRSSTKLTNNINKDSIKKRATSFKTKEGEMTSNDSKLDHSHSFNRPISNRMGNRRKTVAIHKNSTNTNNMQSNKDDDPNLFLKNFIKVFKKFEKVVIHQFVDYDVFFNSSSSCLRYIMDGYTVKGNVYRMAKAKDLSEFAMRNCISSETRKFLIHVYNYHHIKKKHEDEKEKDNETEKLSGEEKIRLQEEQEKKELICTIEREFNCKLFCKAKPDIVIKGVNNKILAVIKEPETTFKNKVFCIYNHKNELVYKIDSDYLQLGVCWRNSLYGKCRETMFPIYKFKNGVVPETSKDKDGLITKKFSACASDNNLDYPEALEIIYPDECSYYDKFLIYLCGLIIEYRFYEIDPRDNE